MWKKLCLNDLFDGKCKFIPNLVKPTCGCVFQICINVSLENNQFLTSDKNAYDDPCNQIRQRERSVCLC